MKRVTKAVVAAMMAFTALTAAAQTSNTVKDDLFAGTEIFAKGATDVNEITMDPGTLGMVDGKDSHRAHNMVLSVVRTYTYDKPGMYRIEDVDAFRNKLNTGEWHCSVHTRSLKSGESTDICNKQRTDDLKETAIITVEPKSLTFIHTIGKSSSGSWSGSSYWMMPGGGMGPGPLDATLRAEMAISQAEMHAQAAEMRAMVPSMMPLTAWRLDSHSQLDTAAIQKNAAEALKRFNDSLPKSAGDAQKKSAEKQPE